MFSFQKIDYRLFFVLLLSNFIPVIYSTVRVYFLGSLPDTWGYSIAAQAAWLNLIYEVISEGLLFSLYFILGQVISQPKAFSERLSVALRVVVATFALFSVNILLFAEPIVLFMGQRRGAAHGYSELYQIGKSCLVAFVGLCSCDGGTSITKA
ncbi:hypothetical protein [Endozoicomonas lisbonensis]|uniref:hypothetical protein n=1 Tax=Endozoicomonas lisbonensis TaxID=3120522 RepID=UPI00339169FA